MQGLRCALESRECNESSGCPIRCYHSADRQRGRQRDNRLSRAACLNWQLSLFVPSDDTDDERTWHSDLKQRRRHNTSATSILIVKCQFVDSRHSAVSYDEWACSVERETSNALLPLHRRHPEWCTSFCRQTQKPAIVQFQRLQPSKPSSSRGKSGLWRV